MDQLQENKRIVQDAEDAWNEGDLNRAFGYFDPQYVENTPFPGLPPTKDGLRSLLTSFRDAFPDGHVTINLIVAEGDLVTYHSTARGTHSGNFMGVEPTGNNITVDAIHIHRVRNGRIVEHWGQSDSLGLMRQLGALPSGGVRP
ncbi:MAG: hypothetical protein QOG60_970 [Frankiaceae bacterium]|jgi:predicted ester cyclase|nr:hypothetical protein [Frankiaceae bacterium]